MEKLKEIITCEYKYDTEEERVAHIKTMEEQGFECDGQVRKSDDGLLDGKREYYWFGRFYKYI